MRESQKGGFVRVPEPVRIVAPPMMVRKHLEGVALCALNRLEEGKNALEEAMRIARSQQAKAYELRAAMDLARLWCDQSKRQQARDLLAPVYGWFTQGFDTRDLKRAQALLATLAS
jgi:predicted ATPase